MGSQQQATGIVLFDSIHFVLAAEKLFKAGGMWIDIVPVPKALSADCGMAIVFREHDLKTVRKILGGARSRVRAIYLRSETGYEEVDG